MHLRGDYSSKSEYQRVLNDLQTTCPLFTRLNLQWSDTNSDLCFEIFHTIAKTTTSSHLIKLKIGGLDQMKETQEEEENNGQRKGRIVDSIAKIIRQNSTLQELDLDQNEIGVESCVKLSEALGDNESLIKLRICGNNIGFRGAKALADALRRNKFLTELHLGYETFGDEGCIAIAKSLFESQKRNRTLRILSMVRCNIGFGGAWALGEALKYNRSLKHLCLDHNQLEDEGCRGISEGLMKNKYLNTLLLSSCSIATEGAKVLAKVLEENGNDGLRKLAIFDNFIALDGYVSIFDALQHNTCLETLDLKLYDFDKAGWGAMEMALQRNYKLRSLGQSMRFSFEEDHKMKVTRSLHFNRDNPLKAQVVKGGSFPVQKLFWLDDSAVAACHVEAIAKVVGFKSLSGLFSFVRERPSFFGKF